MGVALTIPFGTCVYLVHCSLLFGSRDRCGGKGIKRVTLRFAMRFAVGDNYERGHHLT